MMADAKRCDLTGEFFMPEDVGKRRFQVYRITEKGNEELVDLGPTLYRKVEAVLVKTKVKGKTSRVSARHRKRMKWVTKRGWEIIKEQHLTRSKAMKQACREWDEKQGHNKASEQQKVRKKESKPRKKGKLGRPRKRQDKRISADNEKMRKWNSDDREDARLVCPMCNKNPVFDPGEMCPACEQAFQEGESHGG